MTTNRALIRVENLTKHFPITRGIVFQRQVGAVQAVDGISLRSPGGKFLEYLGGHSQFTIAFFTVLICCNIPKNIIEIVIFLATKLTIQAILI